VLGSVSVPAALQALWDAWALALAKVGLGRHLERRFTPHVTLGYSRSAMPAMPQIDPIDWRVDGVALVHSVVGQADYRVLARWPLRAA
jgi:2'-5' RNA ligase